MSRNAQATLVKLAAAKYCRAYGLAAITKVAEDINLAKRSGLAVKPVPATESHPNFMASGTMPPRLPRVFGRGGSLSPVTSPGQELPSTSVADSLTKGFHSLVRRVEGAAAAPIGGLGWLAGKGLSQLPLSNSTQQGLQTFTKQMGDTASAGLSDVVRPLGSASHLESLQRRNEDWLQRQRQPGLTTASRLARGLADDATGGAMWGGAVRNVPGALGLATKAAPATAAGIDNYQQLEKIPAFKKSGEDINLRSSLPYMAKQSGVTTRVAPKGGHPDFIAIGETPAQPPRPRVFSRGASPTHPTDLPRSEPLRDRVPGQEMRSKGVMDSLAKGFHSLVRRTEGAAAVPIGGLGWLIGKGLSQLPVSNSTREGFRTFTDQMGATARAGLSDVVRPMGSASHLEALQRQNEDWLRRHGQFGQAGLAGMLRGTADLATGGAIGGAAAQKAVTSANALRTSLAARTAPAAAETAATVPAAAETAATATPAAAATVAETAVPGTTSTMVGANIPTATAAAAPTVVETVAPAVSTLSKVAPLARKALYGTGLLVGGPAAFSEGARAWEHLRGRDKLMVETMFNPDGSLAASPLGSQQHDALLAHAYDQLSASYEDPNSWHYHDEKFYVDNSRRIHNQMTPAELENHPDLVEQFGRSTLENQEYEKNFKQQDLQALVADDTPPAARTQAATRIVAHTFSDVSKKTGETIAAAHKTSSAPFKATQPQTQAAFAENTDVSKQATDAVKTGQQPDFFSAVSTLWDGLDTESRVLLIGGLSLGTVGLLSAIAGGGGLPSLFAAAMGFLTAGASSGLFGDSIGKANVADVPWAAPAAAASKATPEATPTATPTAIPTATTTPATTAASPGNVASMVANVLKDKVVSPQETAQLMRSPAAMSYLLSPANAGVANQVLRSAVKTNPLVKDLVASLNKHPDQIYNVLRTPRNQMYQTRGKVLGIDVNGAAYPGFGLSTPEAKQLMQLLKPYAS